MPGAIPKCSKFRNSDKFGTPIDDAPTDGGMGKEDRKRRVLSLLVETRLALPPSVIFRNVKYRGADFERRSLSNYLAELEEDGLIAKVDPEALEDREIKIIDMSNDGYFIATDKAVKVVEE